MQEIKVKPGYKMTELGVIPEDWSVRHIGETLKIKHGKSQKEIETKNGKYPILATGGIIGKTNSYLHNKPSVLIGRKGTIDKPQYIETPFWTVDTLFYSEIFNNFSGKFIFYKFNLIDWYNYNEASGVPSLNAKTIEKIIISVPQNIDEQNIIAKILTETDALIKSLDVLINKKEKIKEGTMQELLTGKRRLPGFNGEWIKKELGKIGDFSGSGVDKLSNPNEIPVRLVNYMDVYKRDFIYGNELHHWVTANTDKYNKCRVQKGDIFFTPSSETRQDIGLSAVAMEDIDNAVYSYHIVRLRIKEDWDLKFKSYVFKTKFFMDQTEQICEGGGKRYVVGLGKFRQLEIFYPIDIEEQKAIAEVLSDIDNEIENLKIKRDKYKQIKDGMMQELLTGKIRLV